MLSGSNKKTYHFPRINTVLFFKSLSVLDRYFCYIDETFCVLHFPAKFFTIVTVKTQYKGTYDDQ